MTKKERQGQNSHLTIEYGHMDVSEKPPLFSVNPVNFTVNTHT